MHIENVPVEIQYSHDHSEYKAIFFAIEKGINIQKDLLNKNCSGKFQKNLLSPRQNRPYPTQKCDFFLCVYFVFQSVLITFGFGQQKMVDKMSNGGRPPNGRTNLVNLGGHGGQNVKKEDALPTGGHVASLRKCSSEQIQAVLVILLL